MLEVYHNRKDGIVRSAKVKTRTSELVRPIDKIRWVRNEALTAGDGKEFV